MRSLTKKDFSFLMIASSLLWATEIDPRDKEIMKDLEFFQTLEVIEVMPLLTEFGSVLDEIKADKAPALTSPESAQ